MQTDSEKLGHVFRESIIVDDCYGIRKHAGADITHVLDIGGNMGMFSILCRCLFPKADIHTVEPNPPTFGRLEANTRFFNVHLHQVGLSSGSRLAVHNGRDSGSSSAAEAENGGITGMRLSQMVIDWGIDPSKAILKVDCEGAEKHLLDPQETATVMRFKHFALEMHYSDGRGGRKWPHAMSRDVGELWVKVLMKARYGARYHRTSLGGMFVA